LSVVVVLVVVLDRQMLLQEVAVQAVIVLVHWVSQAKIYIQ
jgi:hypothetical protein